jgi:hypothetical protein
MRDHDLVGNFDCEHRKPLELFYSAPSSIRSQALFGAKLYSEPG